MATSHGLDSYTYGLVQYVIGSFVSLGLIQYNPGFD